MQPGYSSPGGYVPGYAYMPYPHQITPPPAGYSAMPMATSEQMFGAFQVTTPYAAAAEQQRPATLADAGWDPKATFEAYDNQIKSVISFNARSVFPTQAVQHHGGGQKPRVCTAFASNGQCRMGDGCRDYHVTPEAVEQEHARIVAWLDEREKEFHAGPASLHRVFYSDLKEVISVPATALQFTRGLYLTPTEREKRPSQQAHHPQNHQQQQTDSSHRSKVPTIAQQAPTACGLFAENPASCKWGRWCNQAHVDPQWIANHRQAFEQWATELEAEFQAMPDDRIFDVHDPGRRAVLRVPKRDIKIFTRGLVQGTKDKCPSVCLLDLRDRCTAAVRCNQAHVRPHRLEAIREEAAAMAAAGLASPARSQGAATPPPTLSPPPVSPPPEITPAMHHHHHHQQPSQQSQERRTPSSRPMPPPAAAVPHLSPPSEPAAPPPLRPPTDLGLGSPLQPLQPVGPPPPVVPPPVLPELDGSLNNGSFHNASFNRSAHDHVPYPTRNAPLDTPPPGAAVAPHGAMGTTSPQRRPTSPMHRGGRGPRSPGGPGTPPIGSTPPFLSFAAPEALSPAYASPGQGHPGQEGVLSPIRPPLQGPQFTHNAYDEGQQFLELPATPNMTSPNPLSAQQQLSFSFPAMTSPMMRAATQPGALPTAEVSSSMLDALQTLPPPARTNSGHGRNSGPFRGDSRYPAPQHRDPLGSGPQSPLSQSSRRASYSQPVQPAQPVQPEQPLQ